MSIGEHSRIFRYWESFGNLWSEFEHWYYNEHTKMEYLDLNDMEYTTSRIINILKDNYEFPRMWDLSPDREPKDNWSTSFDWAEDESLCPWCHEYVTERDIEMDFCTSCGCSMKSHYHKRDDSNETKLYAE